MRHSAARAAGRKAVPGYGVWACVMLCLLIAAGCSAVQVSAVGDVPQPAQWTVVVFPLEEKASTYAAADFLICGYTGAQGSGAVVAQALARAFDSEAGFAAVGRDVFHRAIREEGLALRDLPRMGEERTCALARKIKAEMVVLGRVLRYRTSWFLFCSKTSIRIELRGLKAATGEALWEGRARKSALFGSPGGMTRTVAERVVEEARKALRSPVDSGARTRTSN